MKKFKSLFTRNIMFAVFSAVLLATFGIFLVGCGEKGEDGSKWITGTDMPTTEVGVNGDMYLDTDDYILYQKENGVWKTVIEDFGKGEIGANGQDGKDGAKWLTGEDAPTEDLGVNGDLYIDTKNYVLYQKSDNIWSILIVDFGKGFDDTAFQNKISELEEKINSGKIDVERLSSYQNEVI